MRRRKALSVRVRNPSRGLVTRLPAEEADELRSGDKNRVFVDANNVRFEDGCVAAAPGFTKVNVGTEILEDFKSHWRMDEASGARVDSHGDNDLHEVTAGDALQSAGLLGNAASLRIAKTLVAEDDTSLSMTGTDFTWTGWAKFSTLSGTKEVITKGLALSGTFEFEILRVGAVIRLLVSANGVSSTTVISSTTVSAATWVFLAVRFDFSGTAVDLRVNSTLDSGSVADIFDGSDALTFGGGGSGLVDVDSWSFWQRALSNDELDLIKNGTTGLDYPFLGVGPITLIHEGNLIDDTTPKPLTMAAGGNLYSVAKSFDTDTGLFTAILDQIFEGVAPADGRIWSAIDFYDKEIYAQRDNVAQYWKPGFSDGSMDLPGLTNDDDDKWDGCESFFSHILLWRDDIIKWSAVNDFTLWIPVSQTIATWAMTVGASGFTQPNLGDAATIPTIEDPATEGVVVGQYISIADEQSGVPFYNYYRVTAIAANQITATLQDFTGATAPMATVTAGDTILSVDANESGQLRTVGSRVNGPIYQILAQGDYAYIFKERSIQTMQYVGLASGVFFIHPEIANEGLLARNALLGLGDSRMIFVGHKEIYSYQGGPTVTPILTYVSQQFFSELDRGRLDEILLFHKEFRNEVWIQYPVVGGHKVLIWNYAEDTATFDTYDPTLKGFTAIEDVVWPVDPSWESLADSVTWDSFDPSLSWSDMASSGGADKFTLVATGSGELLLHGTTFNRAGEAYPCLAETQDFDCGEPDIFKYVDVVLVGLQVRVPDAMTRIIYVQLGYRDWLDSAIKWTTAKPIQVQGGQTPPPLKLNPGGAGRFLRLRFYSTDADVPWRVTSYEIHTRAGSFY